MKPTGHGKSSLVMCLLTVFIAACSHPETRPAKSGDPEVITGDLNRSENSATTSWDQRGAAAYLDQREKWWMTWPAAARDHATFCVSCHTVVPYALARPALRTALSEQAPTDDELLLLANVTKRVRLWGEVAPFYSDKEYGPHKEAESRATEAVLNAFILANSDAQIGRLRENTRTAFANMWALQLMDGKNKGTWLWHQFDLKPWEAGDSQYYGGDIAAVAVGTATENYRSTPEIQNNLKLLREYLTDRSAAQSPINRVALLWAATELPGLLTQEQKQSIIDDGFAKQESDGGWSMSSVTFTWKDLNLYSLFGKRKRDDGTPQESQSDGLATGFILFALERAGMSRQNEQVKRGLDWLVHNQNTTTGSWTAYSLNKRRDPSSNVVRFMSDAATAFAILALTDTKQFDGRTN